MDVITYSSDETGEPRAGWRLVQARVAPQFADQLIKEGEAARASLPSDSPRRAEVATWLATVKAKGYVAAGNYPLKGRAVVIVERASEAARMAARSRSELASAVHRARLLPGATADDSRDRRIEMHKRMTAGFEKSEARKKLGN